MAKSKRPLLNGVVNRIRLVGVELEGGWDVVPDGLVVEKDGSVKFEPPRQVSGTFDAAVEEYRRQLTTRLARGEGPIPERPARPRITPVDAPVAVTIPMPKVKGEIVSRPMEIGAVEEWITKCYPQHVNHTCGLHVHMSFHYRINYSRLMTPAFTPYMVNAVKEWAEQEGLPKDHPQWNRLNPNHEWTQQHCLHQYLGDAQSKVGHKDYHSRGKAHSRYTFVNYPDAQHHTVEVRGLAMFEKADVAVRGVLAVIDATNRFLSKVRERDRTIRAAVPRREEITGNYGSYLNY